MLTQVNARNRGIVDNRPLLHSHQGLKNYSLKLINT